MPPITCHVLDTTRGKPASGVNVAIYRIGDLPTDGDELVIQDVEPFAVAKTNSDGRVTQWSFHPNRDLTPLGIVDGSDWQTLQPGIYKIRFQTLSYFRSTVGSSDASSRTFFPFVEIIFNIDNPPDEHYHIPLLLSNHSYTTYRGS
ncbi:hydroxyisourate hydrolase [Cyberlindnera jadinii NRRL Y-1542]|uniref:5-hydroxyisourate hydrolase n=1 Tax=Cyberlindnera jadinii (strain ATCC 18201 / CBS 1600 / BCRC 20928 / JCM 3617 / NBRC 0987 / NRRL Y-1542) TaxID=983966 RepID=A0A1E4S4H7_CYBJN|nr:Hydroxyisourate hydrolase [Cyberlindnera jadinii NRRL Y-1542]ODV74350.1 Hydroxyisourate hydrolase [Cyberlindnera jadinii NRRL Y-1542]